MKVYLTYALQTACVILILLATSAAHTNYMNGNSPKLALDLALIGINFALFFWQAHIRRSIG